MDIITVLYTLLVPEVVSDILFVQRTTACGCYLTLIHQIDKMPHVYFSIRPHLFSCIYYFYICILLFICLHFTERDLLLITWPSRTLKMGSLTIGLGI